MNKTLVILVIVALVILVGGTYLSDYSSRQVKGIGGGSTADGSYSTSTSATWGTVSYRVLKSGPGVFDGFVILNSKASAMNFYDATTTNSTLRTRAATTTLAEVPASLAAGDFPLGVQFNDGLLVEYPTALGVASGTIMWR